MSLAVKLGQINPNNPGLPCGIQKLMDSLENQADKDALDKVMNMRSYPIGISNRQIHAVLLNEGYDIAFASIRLHRSKQCRCFVGKDGIQRRANREEKTKQPAETKRKVASKTKTSKTKTRKTKAGK